MAAPITVFGDDYRGHILTLAIAHTSTATTNTIAIEAGCPMIDLSVAHPVIGGAYICTEADADISDTTGGYTPANEMPRGTDPDSGTEWMVNAFDEVKMETADKNGYAILTFHAGGSKNT